MEKLQAMTFAVQTAKLEATSCKRSIKFLKTVLISVSSHINATLKTEEERLSGRLLENFRLMLNSTALNLVAIFATEKSSST